MKTLSQIITLLLLFGFAAHSALSTTYKYRDESGNMVYSQNPPPGDTPYEVLGGVRSHAIPGRGGKSVASDPNSEKSIPGTPKKNQKEQQVAEQVEKAKEIRRKNCEAAKKNLEIYSVYHRLQNEQGEMVRLNDAQRQEKINEAKRVMKEFCD